MKRKLEVCEQCEFFKVKDRWALKCGNMLLTKPKRVNYCDKMAYNFKKYGFRMEEFVTKKEKWGELDVPDECKYGLEYIMGEWNEDEKKA